MPENLSGDLAADNLAKFQRVFDRIHSEHVEWTGDKIADEAVKETTFGMTRIEVGYGKLHAIISDFGPAQGLTWVPRTVPCRGVSDRGHSVRYSVGVNRRNN